MWKPPVRGRVWYPDPSPHGSLMDSAGGFHLGGRQAVAGLLNGQLVGGSQVLDDGGLGVPTASTDSFDSSERIENT